MIDHDYLKYYGKIKKDDVILDLGACTGEFARRYEADIVERACLYVAVEPALWCVSQLARYLNKNLPGISVLISSAVWTFNGITEMAIASSHLVGSLGVHGQDVSKWGQKIVRTDMVPCLTLATILGIIGGARANFLKCDIEGGEVLFIIQNQHLMNRIGHVAIACYHDAPLGSGAERTWQLLEPYFAKDLGWKTKLHGVETVDQTMLYAWRE